MGGRRRTGTHTGMERTCKLHRQVPVGFRTRNLLAGRQQFSGWAFVLRSAWERLELEWGAFLSLHGRWKHEQIKGSQHQQRTCLPVMLLSSRWFCKASVLYVITQRNRTNNGRLSCPYDVWHHLHQTTTASHVRAANTNTLYGSLMPFTLSWKDTT